MESRSQVVKLTFNRSLSNGLLVPVNFAVIFYDRCSRINHDFFIHFLMNIIKALKDGDEISEKTIKVKK